MTRLVIKGTVFGVLASGLAACATSPTYPIGARSTAPTTSPATAPTVVPATPPTAASAPAPQAAPQAPPQSVTSQPLAPVQPPPSPPSASAAQSPAVAATPSNSAPPPRVEEPRPRPEPPRYTASGKVIEARRMFRDYQVQRGDHLDAIARDLQTTRAVLVEANHLRAPYALVPGEHLRVPIEKAYVAQSGDTLAAVAKRFDVSPAELADLNAYPERRRLSAGEEVALPAVIHDHGPVLLPPARVASRYSPSTTYTPTPWVPSVQPYHSAGPSIGRAPTPYPSAQTPAGTSLTDAQVTAAGRGLFVWPVKGDIISPFGVQDLGRRNDGVDIRAPLGSSVRSAAAGDVVYAGDQVPGFGNLVLVKHANGWVTAYAHLDRVTVKMRDSVQQGQEIGLVGQSGGVSEPQLHFEIRYAPTPLEKAKPIDPLLVLTK